MNRWLWVLPCLALAGCTPKDATPTDIKADGSVNGGTAYTLTQDGTKYDSTITKPEACNDKVCPVIIALHGDVSGGRQTLATFGLKKFSDKHSVIIVSPNSPEGAWPQLDTDPKAVSDLKFFDQLIKAIPSLGGDPKATYVLGYDRGGILAFRLAALRPKSFAAVCATGAPIAWLDRDWKYHSIPESTGSTSVMIVHGMKDESVGFDLRTNSLDIPTTAEWWAKRLCPNATPTKTDVASGKAYKRSWRGSNGNEVELLAYRDLWHGYPNIMDAQTGFSVNEEIWTFFNRHHL